MNTRSKTKRDASGTDSSPAVDGDKATEKVADQAGNAPAAPEGLMTNSPSLTIPPPRPARRGPHASRQATANVSSRAAVQAAGQPSPSRSRPANATSSRTVDTFVHAHAALHQEYQHLSRDPTDLELSSMWICTPASADVAAWQVFCQADGQADAIVLQYGVPRTSDFVRNVLGEYSAVRSDPERFLQVLMTRLSEWDGAPIGDVDEERVTLGN